jgi:hypothetical protein
MLAKSTAPTQEVYMFDWVWILVALWVGFLLGFFVFALMRTAAGSRSDEELVEAARDYYKL